MFRNALEPWHLAVVVLAAVLLFGSRKLPDTARALGKSLRILKSETAALRAENAEPPAATDTTGSTAPAGDPGTAGAREAGAGFSTVRQDPAGGAGTADADHRGAATTASVPR
ncbi:Sec-independent protein translocase subunit TatA [Streptomyces sp. NPDC049954]|uniref:Sec-independent protein translocase subunit TatA n=1 Tax=Streptomyces sp. NPDC049954 TaxID=3155779 RepID=UPI00342BA7AD